MRKKNGFTMVELLAAIVILGLLSAFAVVSVSAILDRAEKNHYETQEKNMIMAAKSYATDNKNVLPKTVGGSTTIKLSDLQTRKYIGEVLDRSKNTCTEGYVTIFRYSKDGYSYRPYLKCSKFETSQEVYGGTGPEITLSINTNYMTPSFSYEVTNSDDGKIISYRYRIYKHGVLVNDSGSVPVSSVSSVDLKEISLKKLVPGEFEILFTATNNYGYTNTKKITGSIVDENGPECGSFEPNLNDWQNVENVTIVIGCNDASGSGCAKDVFSQIFAAESATNFIEISDNLGHKSSCQVNTYIDRTPPDKPVINNPYENTWINKSYKIKVTSKDDTSGIKYYEYRYPNSADSTEREWKQYENSSREPGDATPFETTSFSKERSEYVEIRACDYAGNCSEVTSSMIKIDKTKPTCTITRSISAPNGLNGWYVSSVTMTLSPVNDLGTAVTAVVSPISYELTTSSTASYTAMNVTAIQNDTSSSGVIYNGYIQDEAGNKNSCIDSSALKIDLTPPEVPVITNPNANSDGTIKWINANYTVTAKSKDVHSGIDYFRYSSDNSNWTKFANSSASPNTYKTVTSSTFSTEGSYGYYVNVCDVAGNCSASSSTTIKLDKTAPSCSTSKTNLNTTSGVNVAVECADNGTAKSGVSTCAGVSGTSASKTGVKEDKTYTVKDVAGNSKTCSVDVSSKTQYNKRTCAANRCSAAGCESGTQSYTNCGIVHVECYTSATVGTGLRSSGGEACSNVNGTWLNGDYYTNCTGSPPGDCTCTKYSCSTGEYSVSNNRCQKRYDGYTYCPVGTKFVTQHAFTYGSETIDKWCSTDTVPVGCTGTAGGEHGHYITACNCTQYYSDSSKCDCSSWNSWGSWSDSSSNYCTDSKTCDGSTRTVYY